MRISDWSSDVCSSDLASGKRVANDGFLAGAEMIEAEPALECAGELSVLGDQSLYLGAIALALQPFLAIGRTLLREQHVHQQIGGIALAGHVIIKRQLHEAPRVARHRRFPSQVPRVGKEWVRKCS